MKKVYGCVFLTGFLFATMEVSLKVAGTGMDSFQLTFLEIFYRRPYNSAFCHRRNEKKQSQNRTEGHRVSNNSRYHRDTSFHAVFPAWRYGVQCLNSLSAHMYKSSVYYGFRTFHTG